MIANERSGQGRYCSRVQSSAVVGRGRLAGLRAHVAAKPKAPALPAVVLLRRSVRLCWLPLLLGPTSSSCIDDGRATTLPLLLSSAMRAPSRCPFMHAQLHHPPCATGLRTKSSHGPTHAMQHSAGPQASQAWRLARVAAKGRGQGVFTYSTVQLTREGAS